MSRPMSPEQGDDLYEMEKDRAQDRRDETLALVTRVANDAAVIGAQAREGSAAAQAVIDAYVLLHSCPSDHIAATLLEIRYEAWKKV